MSILLGDNFSYSAQKPLDGRLKYDTVASMKAVADATMYDGCLAYCVATDKTYQWKSSNTVDETLGKWREFETGGGGGAGSDTTAYHTNDGAETGIVDADSFPFYDNSASASKKSTWSNIKSLLKTYFDTLYNKYSLPTASASTLGGVKIGENMTIEDGVINPSYLVVANKFNKADLYSTTEKVVGCWTDGRPLYQKTFKPSMPQCATNGTGVSSNFSIGATVNEIIKISIKFRSGSGYDMTQESFREGGDGILTSTSSLPTTIYYKGVRCYGAQNSVSTSSDRNKIFLINSSIDMNTYTPVVTVQYTKTTDSANSFKYADENDYSTTEKIVGTWINGSLLYQKTISFTTSSSGGAKTIGSITNLKTVVNIKGVLFLSSAVVPLTWLYSTDGTNPAYVGAIVSGTNVQVMSGGSDYNNKSGYVTIQYTKN